MKTVSKPSTKVFFGLSSFQSLAMFRRGLFYSYLSIYLRYFLDMSVTETTLFATLPMILNVFFQTFIWGVVSDKYQLRRTLIIAGELSAGLGTLIVFYAHRSVSLMIAGWVIIIGLSFVEIFWSASNVGWSALISDIYTSRERSAVQGRLSSVGGIGRVFGVWIGGLLYDGFKLEYAGWGFYEGSLFFVASIIMIVSVIPMLFAPEGGFDSEKECQEKLDFTQVSSSDEENTSNHIMIIFLTACIFINFGRNSIATIFSQFLFLDSGFNVSSDVLSYIVNMQSLAIIFMGLLVGWISKRIGNQVFLLFGTGLAVITLLLIPLTNEILFIYIYNFMRGCSEVIINASSYAFVSTLISPEKRGKYFGVFNATFFLSWGLAGTMISGPLADFLILVGSTEIFAYQMTFIVGAIITLIGFVILLWLFWGVIEKKDRKITSDYESM
ncbi:MAG: MFS transporter [Candidatus Hodarchaeales archaeon]|jgi:MFS family permease